MSTGRQHQVPSAGSGALPAALRSRAWNATFNYHVQGCAASGGGETRLERQSDGTTIHSSMTT